MPKKGKNEIITLAKPHTILKFQIIEKYVEGWARKILGFIAKQKIIGSKDTVIQT